MGLVKTFVVGELSEVDICDFAVLLEKERLKTRIKEQLKTRPMPSTSEILCSIGL